MRTLRKIIADTIHYFTRHGFGSNRWKKQFVYFGEGAKIGYPASILGYEKISIGDETVILDHSRIMNFSANGNTHQSPPPSAYISESTVFSVITLLY